MTSGIKPKDLLSTRFYQPQGLQWLGELYSSFKVPRTKQSFWPYSTIIWKRDKPCADVFGVLGNFNCFVVTAFVVELNR